MKQWRVKGSNLSPSNFWLTTERRWLTKQLHSELPAFESVTSKNMDRWFGGLLWPASTMHFHASLEQVQPTVVMSSHRPGLQEMDAQDRCSFIPTHKLNQELECNE